jgi:hypothetical protein
MNMAGEVADLKRMTVKQLRVRHLEVFGEQTRSGNKDFLWKRIAWRIQALAQGDLSERARRRAEELANDADLRVRRPPGRCLRPASNVTASSIRAPGWPRMSVCGLAHPRVLCYFRFTVV